MENINLNVADITYESELIPPFWADLTTETTAKRAGLIRANNLRRTQVLRKLCAH